MQPDNFGRTRTIPTDKTNIRISRVGMGVPLLPNGHRVHACIRKHQGPIRDRCLLSQVRKPQKCPMVQCSPIARKVQNMSTSKSIGCYGKNIDI
ncbi:hypothetical protein GDO81_007955 [Engystomops pustulosus]|uniref:Uncharacterized protein n=1 Tax=Engystomops pustulosus TaxID=76066 RepID=A0AAV7CAY5_ENGPU|nr:hypothetical protein GDO81_007955 [Engystomops pustulosus]